VANAITMRKAYTTVENPDPGWRADDGSDEAHRTEN